jgi:hypothetical protein
VRFGEPYVKRIRKAMMPHLFSDKNPPAIEVAALGDFGGGIGAALLASNHEKKSGRSTRTKPASSGDGSEARAEAPA